ncbi:MAG: RnfABCDGE type electron transport complex subunit G [Candidatus Poribacteria bacterium]
MKDMISSVLVLTVICAGSALLLTGIRDSTSQQRKEQLLKYVQGPAVKKVLVETAGSTNDPIFDRTEALIDDGSKLDVFVGKVDGKLKAIAFEAQAEGFGGTVSVMVGIDPENETLVGIGVSAPKETPGVGSRVAEEPFGKQFPGLSLDENIAVKADGGIIDAVSGATTSSRAACKAVRRGIELYKTQKDNILSAVQSMQ